MNKLYPVKQIFLSLFLLILPAALHAQVPKSNHVVVVLEENHSYSSVVGSSAMPYFNSLASQNVLATQYYANTHPSIGNYLMMTTGQIITNDDAFTGTVSAPTTLSVTCSRQEKRGRVMQRVCRRSGTPGAIRTRMSATIIRLRTSLMC